MLVPCRVDKDLRKPGEVYITEAGRAVGVDDALVIREGRGWRGDDIKADAASPARSFSM